MLKPRVIFEDNHLLVIYKPAGYLSQGDGHGGPDVLTYFKDWIKVRDQKPGAVYLGLVHRLDRPVSGVMVLAKTSKCASRLSEQVRTHQLTKTYRAVVTKGQDLPAMGQWEDYLYKEPKTYHTRVVSPTHPQAQQAKLAYRLLQLQGNLAEVEVDLFTGRHHQIRVQFASRGHALYSDHRYGEAIKGHHLALYAHQLGFFHPITREACSFTAPPPPDWPIPLHPNCDH